MQKASMDRMKELFRRGMDLEPFFMSTPTHAFRVNAFYAEIVGTYDDGLADDALRPWRLRQMHDQNGSKAKAWDSQLKLQELEEQMGGREVPKRVLFDLLLDVGALSKAGHGPHAKSERASHWRIHVKGYGLVMEASRDMPVKVSSYGREDPHDLYEVMAYQSLYDGQTGERIPPGKVASAYQLSDDPADQAQVVLSEDEVKSLRTFGCIPGIKLLGFKDQRTLSFLDNIKHAYFLYPSDLEHAGSKRTFAALLQSMLTKKKYALGLYMPRENVIPAFVAILPQAEERDEEGSQLVPPGMNMVILPYADDMRDAPPAQNPMRTFPVLRSDGRRGGCSRRRPRQFLAQGAVEPGHVCEPCAAPPLQCAHGDSIRRSGPEMGGRDLAGLRSNRRGTCAYSPALDGGCTTMERGAACGRTHGARCRYEAGQGTPR